MTFVIIAVFYTLFVILSMEIIKNQLKKQDNLQSQDSTDNDVGI